VTPLWLKIAPIAPADTPAVLSPRQTRGTEHCGQRETGKGNPAIASAQTAKAHQAEGIQGQHGKENAVNPEHDGEKTKDDVDRNDAKDQTVFVDQAHQDCDQCDKPETQGRGDSDSSHLAVTGHQLRRTGQDQGQQNQPPGALVKLLRGDSLDLTEWT
jgi:hypothetical protein